MVTPVFIGRNRELERLESLRKTGRPNLVVLKGRRRVGKSRLVHFFATSHPENKFWNFAGLAPEEGMDAQTQRDYFARQLAAQLKTAPFTFNDWFDAFEYLASHLQPGDMVLFDEISWMGAHDRSFIPKLKAWWDKQQLPIIMVFCGSVSTWIEDNILKSTAFFGRINLTITLDPLSISEANQLLRSLGFQGSDYDVYQLLSILGGIPWYLEQVTPGQTVDTLIKRLCFEKDGLLVTEFNRIFHDCFGTKGVTYKKILNSLKDGMKTLAEVRTITEFSHSGTLSAFMEHLIVAGFVQKQSLWSFKTYHPLKQSLYRICDPYMRFYLKLIEPNRNKIDMHGFDNQPISSLVGFDAHIGLQLEHLLLQNRSTLVQALGIHPSDIIADGPFRQNKTKTKAGCQIDYLVQTRTKNVFVCEFKFKRQELGVEMIAEAEAKIKALQIPRGFAAIPVLFHIGGVSTPLAISDYFYRIIDISDFLDV